MSRTPSRRLLPVLLTATLLAGACAHFENLPTLQPEDLEFKLAQSSKIFDSKGRLITTLHRGQNRTNVTLDQIPQVLQNAVIAIEDERFYEHGGVDLRAIFRAALANASAGDIEQGGSTITQQYVKNVIISPNEIAEQTIDRKLQEAALARQIEKKLSKDEILERYLNTVYFGQGAYGVQAASKVYFGKPVSKVTLKEAALLAGLIRSPGDYDPFRNGNAAKRRRSLVLRQMADLGYVDELDADAASAKGLGLQPVDEKDEYPAPYFVDYVQRLLTYHPQFDFLGKTAAQRTKRLFTGGLRIYTTVDLEMQAAAEQAVAQTLSSESDPHAALVAVEPDSGHVKAMVGGRDWFAPPKQDKYAKLNLAILAEPDLGRVKVPGTKRYLRQAPGTGRQAGSAFKPFALAAAIEEGVPLSKRYDGSGPLVIPGVDNGGDYTVQNYEGGQFGEITLLEATVSSVNVVYAQLVDEIGPDPVVDVAQRMGISTPLQPFFSAVLGTNEVNALGMASAYGTLANNGDHHPPVAVTKIVDASNEEKKRTIYRDKTEPMEDVLDEGAAYLTTSALQEVVRRGTGQDASAIARPAAGKTGTAQEYRDAWFVGYTPNLVTSVWVGYPQGQIEMKTSCLGSTTLANGMPECIPTRLTVTGGSWPTEIWTNFMLVALTDYPVEDFPVPEGGIIEVPIDTRNGCLADRFTPDEYVATGVFAKGTEPEEACREPGDKKTVENLIGFPRGQAVRILEGEGFNVVTEAAPLGSYPPGTVVDQDPPGGTKVPAGATVTLYIASEGVEDTAIVPDVRGLSRDEAEARIRDAGFEVLTVVERQSSPGQAKKNKGRVWKQAPGPGAEADEGDTVTIWVNPG
ncbi:MAG TPA: transglycosylase domain-containing protein [Actinomycetota bacterium]|nr:transglycosylase domain-containing protein [Actinomycetota bacterium]